MKFRFEIRKARKGFYFLLKAANGRVLAHSETYNRKAGAENAVRAIHRAFVLGADDVPVEDKTETKPRFRVRRRRIMRRAL